MVFGRILYIYYSKIKGKEQGVDSGACLIKVRRFSYGDKKLTCHCGLDP